MKYNLGSRIIHWLMAILIIGELCLGIFMDEFLPDEASYRYTIYDIHKSIGVSIFLLLVLRIVIRLIAKTPQLPATMSVIEQRLAKLGHLTLYFLMIMVPVSGYLMSSFAGYPVKLFGAIIPSIVAVNFDYAEIASEIHEACAYFLLAVIGVHILAVIKHRYFDKAENDVLKRMI